MANLTEEEKLKLANDTTQKPKTQQDQVNQWGSNYSDPGQSQITFTGTPEEIQGQQSGLDLAKMGYGQTLMDTGKDVQDLRKEYKDRVAQGGSDPVSAAIMGQKANNMVLAQQQMVGSGLRGAASAAALGSVGKAQDAQIAESLYGQKQRSLNDLKSLTSNTLSGTIGLMQGSKAEGTAGSRPAPPEAKGLMDSVLCTELHRQGLMSRELYLKDAAYGIQLKISNPNVVVGYQFLAAPFVALMSKSSVFTSIMKYPILSWARHIAGEKYSVWGHLCQNIGEPFCAVIGKLISKLSGAVHEGI
jgi:hypothetical protein